MGIRRRTVSGGVTLALVMGVLLACGSIHEDELLCEEAVSRLEECCPAFDPHRFSCVNSTTCLGATRPDLTEKAATCVRDRSCGDLVTKETCATLTRIGNEPYPSNAGPEIEQEACK